MLTKSATPKPENAVTPDDTIKNPSVLEFLDLKDEYPEFDLERMNHEPTECTRAIGLHRYSRLIAGVILV
jgi:predicted nuclease of restriction endonuclease-like (RecB) superfamily